MADRRLAAATAAVLAAAALAACSAGVPPTGKVVTVTPVEPAAPAAPAASEGSGPRPGSTETDVAKGFMFAMNNGDNQRVLRWVATGKARAQVERWSPRTPINVYDSFEPRQPTTTDGRRIVNIQVKRIGRLEDGREWTPDTQETTVPVEVRRVGAEWRVANPDEIWMDESSFKRLYGPVDLFMVAADRQHLAPVSVFVRRAPSGTNSLTALERRAEDALRLLLQGPQGRVALALVTAIPAGTELRSFTYRDGLATVDLNGFFTAPAGGLDGRLRVGQVVWTVTRLIQTAQVRILVDGRAVGPVGADRFLVDRGHPWQRTMPPLAGLWPQRSSVTSDDKVLFIRKDEIYSVRPEPSQQASLMPFETAGLKSFPTWSPNHQRIAFLVSTGSQQSLWIGEPGDQKALPIGLNARRLSPPSWSPDSEHLYVLGQDGARTRLNVVNLVSWSVATEALAPLPGNLQPTLLEVSPDGAFVLAIGAERGAQPADGGQLFVGALGPDGATSWFPRPIAPGLGTVFSPVWVDPLTVAFIAQTTAKGDLGKLWIMRSDGWDPTPVLDEDTVNESAIDIGNQVTVDPAGAHFIFTVGSEDGTSLWMVDRQGGGTLRPLTVPLPNDFATDPSFASR